MLVQIQVKRGLNNMFNKELKKVAEAYRARRDELLKENFELKEKVTELRKNVYELKKQLEKNEIDANKDILNMLKAILYHCADSAVTICDDDIKEVEEYDIYIEEAMYRRAKRVKLITNKNIIKVDELK